LPQVHAHRHDTDIRKSALVKSSISIDLEGWYKQTSALSTIQAQAWLAQMEKNLSTIFVPN
jgi:hypothetical protein